MIEESALMSNDAIANFALSFVESLNPMNPWDLLMVAGIVLFITDCSFSFYSLTSDELLTQCTCIKVGRQPLFRQSQSTAGRVGSVHDFLAGRVNRNGSDVLELGYSSGNLRKQQPDAIVPMTSGVVGQKGGRGREHCKYLTKF